MLDSKQRKNLRKLSHNIDPIFQIGKGGISDSTVEELKKALHARELIKINVLKNCDFTAKELIDDLALNLKAEAVCAVGNKIVLYKKSSKKDIVHINTRRV